ncbi:MAG TPA: hypothetical protein VM287_08585 [Egibacteraceae bacterium]|nr:hypothetical protein [Egibacteraceae bacterium]
MRSGLRRPRTLPEGRELQVLALPLVGLAGVAAASKVRICSSTMPGTTGPWAPQLDGLL